MADEYYQEGFDDTSVFENKSGLSEVRTTRRSYLIFAHLRMFKYGTLAMRVFTQAGSLHNLCRECSEEMTRKVKFLINLTLHQDVGAEH